MAARGANVAAGLRPQRGAWALRLALLTLCVIAAIPSHHVLLALLLAVGLVLVAAPTLRVPGESAIARISYAAEVLLACAAVTVTGWAGSPFFFYLLAPVFAAGVTCGPIYAVIFSGLGAAALLVSGAVSGHLSSSSYTTSTAEYVVVTTAVGLVAGWARRLLRLRQADEQPLYSVAYRLLSQLRTIARQLPGSLDTVTVTTSLLDELSVLVPHDRSAVFSRTHGGRLVPLAGNASGAPHWDIDLAGDSPFAAAWTSQQPQVVVAGGTPWLMVLPLVVGVRTCGLVAVESARGRPPAGEALDALVRIAEEAALRLETSLLFDEVRDIATAEERQRLAREIHDGIAQELVTVGYGVDNAIAELAPDVGARATLDSVRAEVTRIISELRLSLFDLRSDVEPHGGLGAAISAYLRAVGATSGLTVHITLNESTHRLPTGTEAELLRIVQEAVTNVRRHAGADNVWVSCDIDPPRVRILVEDDGAGFADAGRADSFGLSIMRERAGRLRAALDVRPRAGGGTTVEVRIDGQAGGRTLAATVGDPAATEGDHAHHGAAGR